MLYSISYEHMTIVLADYVKNVRLTAKFCVLPIGTSVQGLRCPQSLRPAVFVLRQRKQKRGQLRLLHRQAGTEALLVFYGSSTSAKQPQKSPITRQYGMRDRVGKSRLRLASYMPPTPEGRLSARHLPSRKRQCDYPLVNIIYRDCVTGRLSPPVFASHTI